MRRVLRAQNLNDEMHTPGAVPSPPLMWSYYGVALRQAGCTSDAVAAYESGLNALDGRIDPDTPEWRESTRILLLMSMVQAHRWVNNKVMIRRTLTRLFREQIQLLVGDDRAEHDANTGEFVVWDTGSGCFDVYELKDFRSTRCWRTVQGPDPLGRLEHMGLDLFRIEEADSSAQDMGAAQSSSRRRGAERRGFVMAVLPPTACSVCGKTPAKFCAICKGPAYCDKACQVADWPNHKKDPACKAARAAAKAAAVGTAA